MLKHYSLLILFSFIVHVGLMGQEFASPLINPFELKEHDVTQVLGPFFGDLDNDGDQDLISAITTRSFGIEDKGFDFWENIGSDKNPLFSEPVRDTFGLMLHEQFGDSRSSFHVNAGTIGDLDSDGDLDILVNASYPPGFSIRHFYYENIGDADNPLFDVPLVNPFGLDTENRKYTNTFADMNNDGLLDILYLETGENRGIGLLENQGTRENPEFVDLGQLSMTNLDNNRLIGSVTTADIDSDGDLDILAGISTNGGAYAYYENQGNSIYVETETQPFGLPDPLGRSYPFFVDLDGDQDLDIMTAVEQSTPYIYDFYYYENITLLSSSTEADQTKMTVYPTLTDGLIYFSDNSSIEQIEVYNSLGALVEKFDKPGLSINLAGKQTGLHYLVIYGKNESKYIKKIMRF